MPKFLALRTHQLNLGGQDLFTWSQSVVFPNQVSGRSRLEVWGSRCNVDYLWGFVDYLWVFDDYLWGFWCLFHGVLIIICGHFDNYLRFFLMIVCGEVGAMLILCADFDDYLWTFSWLLVGILWLFVQSLGIICGTFDDYFWGSRWNVDNFLRSLWAFWW